MTLYITNIDHEAGSITASSEDPGRGADVWLPNSNGVAFFGISRADRPERFSPRATVRRYIKEQARHNEVLDTPQVVLMLDAGVAPFSALGGWPDDSH